jgi:cleavage and polyadenylation specificity factor subunit 2
MRYIDFEGRASEIDVKNILQKMKPRQLILVRGYESCTNQLKQYCENENLCEKVEVPINFKTIDMTIDSHMFRVLLKQNLYNKIRFASHKNYDLAYIQGLIREEKQNTTTNKNNNENNNDDDSKTKSIRYIAPLKYDQSLEEFNLYQKGHKPIFIGDVKLNQFRILLINNGFKAEFQSGQQLICNDEIMLKRDKETHEIQIQGSMSSTYFKVRELLYGQYQIL